MIAHRWPTWAVVVAGLVLLAQSGAPTSPGAGLATTQRDRDSRLTARWSQVVAGQPAPDAGEPVARLAIPALGVRWVVVEGVDAPRLADAPGHYPQTALPGQVGNFAVAAHRVPGLFGDLDRLAPGDLVLVEADGRTHTYTVTGTALVAPTAVSVLAPVPGAPDATARQATLTLTTCEPGKGTDRRLVVFAELRADPRHGRNT